MGIADNIDGFARDSGLLPPEGGESEDARPELYLDKNMAKTAQRAGLILANKSIFKRDGRLVYVDPEERALLPLEVSDFQTRIQEWAKPWRTKKTVKDDEGKEVGKEPVEVTPKEGEAKLIMAAWGFRQCLRTVSRVNTVPMPVIRDSGELEMLDPGYDKATKTWTLADDGIKVVRDVDPAWSVEYLKELHKDFPIDERALSVHLAALLTMYGAHLISPSLNRPAFAYMANAAGSGKTLLAQMAPIVVMGSAAGITMPKNEDGLTQILNSIVLSASPYLFLDNCEGVVNPKELSAFITLSDWNVRLMHKQQMKEVANLCVVILTGNDFLVRDDMERRSFWADLFVEEADPEERKVENPIDVSWLKRPKNRSDILSALWGLIRRWDAAGRPHECGHRKSFERWSEVIGGILVENGFVDPHEKANLATGGNNEREDVYSMVAALMGPEEGDVLEYSFGRMMTLCRRHGFFEWLLPPITEAAHLEDPTELSEVPPTDAEINSDISLGVRSKVARILRKWSANGRKYKTQHGYCLFGNRGIKRHTKYKFTNLGKS